MSVKYGRYVTMKTYVDTSVECAICLESLDDDPERTITLTCGHRWHLTCLKEQLENAQPSRTKRLLFTGYRCAKCAVFCDHPKLENMTRRTDALRGKVDDLVAEQIRTDAPKAWSNVANDLNAKARLIDEGRRSYAFYLCGGCDEPYFGGTVECAEEDEGELTTSEERLCQSCSPKVQSTCKHTLDHRPFHVWKCRYCCNPSKIVCYGNVHFCEDCHDRNSKRSRGPRHEKLEGVPCCGDNCNFPKPAGRERHLNGTSFDCEQVYFCVLCNSSPSGHFVEELPGSINFIINPNGEEGTRGWQTHPHHNSWAIERMDIPIDESTRVNFVSSYNWSVMSQSIPLHQLVRHPSTARLEISARYMGRTDCPSVFKLQAVVTNSMRVVIHQSSTATLLAPSDCWEKATLIIEPVEGAYEVAMIVCGKDERFWQGNFGSKLCRASIRVLGTQEEMRDILVVDQNPVHQANFGYLREKAFEIILPVLLIFLLWLIS